MRQFDRRVVMSTDQHFPSDGQVPASRSCSSHWRIGSTVRCPGGHAEEERSPSVPRRSLPYGTGCHLVPNAAYSRNSQTAHGMVCSKRKLTVTAESADATYKNG